MSGVIPMASVLGTLERLAAELSSAGDRAAAWRRLDDVVGHLFGHRLFTVLRYWPDAGVLSRIYSSRPDINPVGAMKRTSSSPWTKQVLERGEIFVGSTADDIRRVFADHDVLYSIGCESVLNVPVRSAGVTLGTLNLLDGPGRYDHCNRDLAVLVAQLVSGQLMSTDKPDDLDERLHESLVPV